MKLTLEQLETFRRDMPAPTRAQETCRAFKLPDPGTSHTELEHVEFTAEEFNTPGRGPHLRWVVNCDVAL